RAVGVSARTVFGESEAGVSYSPSPVSRRQASLLPLVRESFEVSSIFIRLSGRTWSMVPSKKATSAEELGPVFTRSPSFRTLARSAAIQSISPTGFTDTDPDRVVKRAPVKAGGGEGVDTLISW